MFHTVIKHGVIIFFLAAFFLVLATLLILSDNVSNEIRTNFLLSKASKQNEILDNVLLSNSLTISITLSLT